MSINDKLENQTDNGTKHVLGEGDITLIKLLVEQLNKYSQVWGFDEAKLVGEGEMLIKRLEGDSCI